MSRLRSDGGNLAPMAMIILTLTMLVSFGASGWLIMQIKESDHAIVVARQTSALQQMAQHVVQEANVAGITAARTLAPVSYPGEQERVTLNSITFGSDDSLAIKLTAQDTRSAQATSDTQTVTADLAGVGAYLGTDATTGDAVYGATSADVPSIAIWTLNGGG